MNQLFFKSDPEVYEAVLSSLDAAWGFPKNGFKHCFLPLLHAPKAGQYAYLAIRKAEAEMEPAASMLLELLATGQVLEVSAAEYRAAIPQV